MPYGPVDRDSVPRVHLADDAFRATDRGVRPRRIDHPDPRPRLSIALIWQVAIPEASSGPAAIHGALVEPILELVVRTTVVILLLKAGYAVSGAMTAVFAGLAFVFLLGSGRFAITSAGNRCRCGCA
jgi:hypothetical protein